jgi:hypothetical protein
MRGVVMYAPGDVRVEDRPEPVIEKPTDAVIWLSASCVCGSDPAGNTRIMLTVVRSIDRPPRTRR